MLAGAELASGSALGKYEIIRKLAVGGMAQIYLARVRGTAGFEKLVVLKRILPSVAEDAGFVKMFLDEARLAATLRHPNIADVFDVGAEAGSYYFAMEFIHGQDTRSIRVAAYELDRDIPFEVAVAIASGTAYALAYAHAKTGPSGPLGIVHRDISPSNILVSYDGAVKLVDFGIARANMRSSDEKTRTGTLKGKVPYMSPEQCKGKTLDRRSDLFSLGTVIYELTTGRRPFEGHSEYDTLEMIVLGRLTPPAALVHGYPPALEAIVLKLLERDPAARYQDADTLLHDLENMAAESAMNVSERVLAKYMRELFADEIAGSERADEGNTQPLTLADLEILRTSPNPTESTQEYPDGLPPPQLLEEPTLPVKIDEQTGEPMHPLLVTPDVQVFVRTPTATPSAPIAHAPDFTEEASTVRATNEHVGLALATQPDRTRLDTVSGFDPMFAFGDDLLDEVDEGAPGNESPRDRALRRVTELCARAAAWVADGELEHAVIAAELALEEPATDEQVRQLVERERRTLLAAFEAFLGDTSRPLALGRPIEELADGRLDHSSADLLAQVDGQLTAEDLIAVSGLSRFEAARQLCRLILRKMIVV